MITLIVWVEYVNVLFKECELNEHSLCCIIIINSKDDRKSKINQSNILILKSKEKNIKTSKSNFFSYVFIQWLTDFDFNSILQVLWARLNFIWKYKNLIRNRNELIYFLLENHRNTNDSVTNYTNCNKKKHHEFYKKFLKLKFITFEKNIWIHLKI